MPVAPLLSRITAALHTLDAYRQPGPGVIATTRESGLTAAAVLVPLVQRDDALSLLLTRRTEQLRDHPGQISFPGGRLEPSDPDVIAAALRETEEELGITENHIEVLGGLDELETGTGFRVFPIVARIHPEFSLEIDATEVAEVFEVPAGFALDQRNHQQESLVFDGRKRRFHSITYRDYRIWGATAAMLVNMSNKLP
ncbi:MAG: CoA pyrophosphatase [Gammaproteobacteria bacterium]|nr:CoA pyrophosphatase [Gammaproteobacteria bacterium]